MNEKHHWTSWLAHAVAVVALACAAADLWLHARAETGDDLGFTLFFVVTLFVGWFLAWRRPRIALGWMVLAIPSSFSLWVPVAALGHALMPTSPTAAGWLLLLGGENTTLWVPPVGLLLSQIPLRFPTGSLPSKRWRWFSWYSIAAIVAVTVLGSTVAPELDYGVANPAYLAWGVTGVTLLGFLDLGLVSAFVGSLASLFVRYRRAGTVERAQLRWVLWAAAVAIGELALSWLIFYFVLGGEDGQLGWIYQLVSIFFFLGYCLVPVAILVAVMRFGLYGIDRIISRTVSYAIVVIVVVALYAAVVVGLTAIIPNLSSVGVALATLAAAAVFLPLLRRVQRGVDRRFNRSAYDAQQILEAFGQRLRTGADPHTAAADLAAAVDRALQPSALGVWTR